MNSNFSALKAMPSSEVVLEAKRLARCEREATAALVACLAEVDTRQLFLSEGYSSMFAYCTQALHLSEGASYNRIEVARISRRFPMILRRLATGEVSLSVIRLIAGELTEENQLGWFDKVRYESKRKVEEMLKASKPQPDVAPSVRKLPEQKQACSRRPGNAASDDRHSTAALAENSALPLACGATVPAEPAIMQENVASVSTQSHAACSSSSSSSISPLSAGRYRFQCTISAGTRAKLEHAQNMLRHSVPSGDLATVLDRALTVLVEKLDKQKFGATHPTRKITAADEEKRVASDPHKRNARNDREANDQSDKRRRRIPAAIRRAVWERDGGQCTFVGNEGRCTSRAFLEFHHIVPFAMGGGTSIENVRLLCRAHNAHEAEQTYGSMRRVTTTGRAG